MLTMTDLFCGAGGSSTGATAVPGVGVRMAVNHWRLAVDTHNANHPEADHDCADVSQVDPRRYPRTDLLWASPECTNHSQAKGRKRVTGQGDLFDHDPLPDEAAQRSRATMWDVVRFTEHHAYAAVIVENVVDAYHWPPFTAWLTAMGSLGYAHQLVWLNSMHAQAAGLPAPQSRDRLYIVFHRSGNRRPDLAAWQRPRAWCPVCDVEVRAVQAWKNPDRRHGRYRRQYLYRCPNVSCCNQIVEPGWLPAASIIDWTLPGQRIGDRARPLAANTRARNAAGIARYWQPVHLEAADPHHPQHGGPGAYYRAWPTSEPLRTLHTIESKALAVPLIGELRGGGSTARPAAAPLATVTAAGNHHALLTPGTAGRWWSRPAGPGTTTPARSASRSGPAPRPSPTPW
jgi:DNA (cytosine-5)-methyltransferase 1